jgi:hypothetical protein
MRPLLPVSHNALGVQRDGGQERVALDLAPLSKLRTTPPLY